jgi:hypothetical protein
MASAGAARGGVDPQAHTGAESQRQGRVCGLVRRERRDARRREAQHHVERRGKQRGVATSDR